MRKYIISAGIIVLWVGWFALLIFGPGMGLFFSGETNNEYARSGAFGDSFGVIASLMTTIAAVGVYLTFSAEVSSRRQQEFESNFFTLLSNFESVTSTILLERTRRDPEAKFEAAYDKLRRAGQHKVTRSHQGREALQIILFQLRNKLPPESYRDIKSVARAYQSIFNRYVNLVGHYFRSLYQIYKLIDSADYIDKNYYARIIRAQLSNQELCLIGYNLIVGEGRHKFKKLAKDYALLHNIHREGLDDRAEAELGFLVRKLHSDTFRFEPITPITYDD